jgi:hypothetical protein
MSSNPNVEERYPSDISRPKILEQYKSEVNESRNALLSSYNSGYGNLTGFHLSYKDAVEGRNISDLQFNGNFIEDENFSILPNFVSRRAANIWNSEGKVVDLPSRRNDNDKELIGEKKNTGDFPLNITGSLRGSFNKFELSESELTKIPMPIPKYLQRLYEYRLNQRVRRSDNNENNEDDQNDFGSSSLKQYENTDLKRVGNITQSEGSIKLSFFNTDAKYSPETKIDLNDTALLTLSMRLNDKSDNDEHIMSLTGVYHQDTGNIVVASRSAKFDGIYALPQLHLSSGKHFEKAKFALFNELNETKIDEINFERVENFVDASDECEYIGYFHIESTNLTKQELQQIDYELINPIGRPHRNVPKLELSNGLLYSPNCGILLDLEKAEGLRDEVYENGLKKILLVASFVVLLQIVILIRQMANTNTPSTLSRLSFWSISIMNMADGSMSVVSLLCSMIFTDLYIQFAVCAFLAFTCSAIYEMKYAIQIYCTQINERPLDWRTMLQGTPIDERTVRNTDNETANDNDTTRNINNAADVADEQSLGAELYTRHFFTMLVFLFVLLNVITWPKKQRQVFEYISLTIFNSYWIPQIYRNVLRGSRTSFSWEFIISTSILRLLPVIYIETFNNPFNHHRDLGFVIFLITWIGIQVSILLLQELLGARFFLSDDYLPKAYDYHPIITKGDIESGFNLDANELVIDGASSTNEDSRNLKYVTDCAICMQKLEIPIINTESDVTTTHPSHIGDNASTLLLPASIGKGASNIIARRKYMVTPCKHVFHTDCLENWMMYKLQCPVCRNSLPPF